MPKKILNPAGPGLHSRRDFLRIAVVGSVGGWLVGCATNPVTGRRQFMLMTEDGEISLDRQYAPHQISEDFGPVPFPGVNAYVTDVGSRMAAITHRPQMPYTFRGVHASHINAYAFPGGTIACTRGILAGMQNEAQLAALLGHELGHVNARHSASRQSKAMLTQLAVAGVVIAVGAKDDRYVPLAQALGGMGAGLLLARYSRADERQADALGMEYMVKAGHNPAGMAQLMDLLVRSSERQPGALEMMFATHPMSTERLETAQRMERSTYAAYGGLPVNAERYMDSIGPIRSQAKIIENIQHADVAMTRKNWGEAEAGYRAALSASQNADYEALIKISHCCRAQNKLAEAQFYANLAKQVMPNEAQAFFASGLAALQAGRSDLAYANFSSYEHMLPGNANLQFYAGCALEGLGRKSEAAEAYVRYLQAGGGGESGQYAVQRLTDWGVIAQP